MSLCEVSRWDQRLDLSEGVTLLGTSWSPRLRHGEALWGLGLADSWSSDPGDPASASSRK